MMLEGAKLNESQAYCPSPVNNYRFLRESIMLSNIILKMEQYEELTLKQLKINREIVSLKIKYCENL